MVFRDRENPCPYCGRPNDAAAHALNGAELPTAGNWSVCWGCGAVAIFTGDGLATRQLTDAEIIEAQRDHDLQEVLRARHAYLATEED